MGWVLWVSAGVSLLLAARLLPVPVWVSLRVRGRSVVVDAGLGWRGRLALRRRWGGTVVGYGLLPPRLALRGRGARRPLVVGLGQARRWRFLPLGALRLRLGRLRPVRLQADVEVGTGEAATTGLAAGALWATLTAVLAALGAGGVRPSVRVRPSFGAPRLVGRVRCIGAVPAGHIISAGLLALRDRVSRNLVRGAADPRAGGRPAVPADSPPAPRGGRRRWSTPSRYS